MTDQNINPPQNTNPPGTVMMHGKPYLTNPRGDLRPLDVIKPQHLLEHEMVHRVFGFARDLSDQVARFKVHTMADLAAFDDLLLQEYGLTKGGPKGNKSYRSYDGCLEIKLVVRDFFEFGPELSVAKGLFDECINEWAADTSPVLRSLVTRAFQTDKSGQVSRANIFALLTTESDDARWTRAQDAIRDAMRLLCAKEYIQFHFRDQPGGPQHTLTVNLAKA